MKYSDCCGAPASQCTDDGPVWDDLGICPECREYCTFEDEQDDMEADDPVSVPFDQPDGENDPEDLID